MFFFWIQCCHNCQLKKKYSEQLFCLTFAFAYNTDGWVLLLRAALAMHLLRCGVAISFDEMSRTSDSTAANNENR